MPHEFFTREDMTAKISGGFVAYDGDVYVASTIGPYKNFTDEVVLYDLLTQKVSKTVRSIDPLFDHRPFKLGFMNGKISSHFISRAPKRERTDSHSSRNLLSDGQYAESYFFYQQGMKDLYRGVYPSFDEALSKKDRTKTAFDRYYAIDHRDNVIKAQDNETIGILNKGRVIILEKGDSFIHTKILTQKGVNIYDVQ